MCGRAEPGPAPLGGPGPRSRPGFPPPQPGWGSEAPRQVGAAIRGDGARGGSHQRGDSGDLGTVLLPGLQILQCEERRVVQTERVGLDGVVEALLEGVVLELQHEPARLLPLRLPLLRRLPPAPGEGEGQHCHAPGPAGPSAGPQPSREPRPARSLRARDRLPPGARFPREAAGLEPGLAPFAFVVPPGASGGKSARRPPACPDMVASPTIKLVLFSSSPPRATEGSANVQQTRPCGQQGHPDSRAHGLLGHRQRRVPRRGQADASSQVLPGRGGFAVHGLDANRDRTQTGLERELGAAGTPAPGDGEKSGRRWRGWRGEQRARGLGAREAGAGERCPSERESERESERGGRQTSGCARGAPEGRPGG